MLDTELLMISENSVGHYQCYSPQLALKDSQYTSHNLGMHTLKTLSACIPTPHRLKHQGSADLVTLQKQTQSFCCKYYL